MTDNASSWILMPASPQDIELVRLRCRRLVRRRAVFSATVSALPIPGLDLLSDLGLFAVLIDDINREFGLTAEQIERLHPRLKLLVFETAVGVGSMLVGRYVTRELLLQLFKHSGIKLLLRQAAKLVPLAGQIASAMIGFAAFRLIGDQHVDACARVAQALLMARPA